MCTTVRHCYRLEGLRRQSRTASQAIFALTLHEIWTACPLLAPAHLLLQQPLPSQHQQKLPNSLIYTRTIALWLMLNAGPQKIVFHLKWIARLPRRSLRQGYVHSCTVACSCVEWKTRHRHDPYRGAAGSWEKTWDTAADTEEGGGWLDMEQTRWAARLNGLPG